MKYVPALPPRAHQIEGLNKARGRPGFGWLMEMGTGKTKTDLDETGELYCEGEITACLMLAPKGVYTNWETDEIPKHWTDDFRQEVTIGAWRGGGTRANRDEIERLFTPDPTLKFFAMNIEALGASDRAFDIAHEFVSRHRGRIKISIDESTAIKNPTAVRTKAVDRLRDMANYRRILCGQPVPNGPMDLFSQMNWAVPGSLGSSFYAYRARYAILQKQMFGTRAVQQIVGYRDIDELAERIRPHTFRKRKDECLDLPEQIYLPPRTVELTDQQRRIYNEVKENATALLSGDDYVTATLALTQVLRLHQILCGHVVDEMGRTHRLDSNRPRVMLEATEEMAGSGIIWATYRDDIERIEETLRKAYGADKVVSYHGGVPQDQRDIAKRRFQDGYADWFVGTPQAASRGLTLVRTPNSLYYSNSHNLDHRDQSESRTHRDGQHWPCVYGDLQVPGTVEEKIVQALRKKIDLATAVLKDGYRSWVI